MRITVYCDSTDLFTEAEIEIDNLADLEFPDEVVKQYWKERCDLTEEDRFHEWLANYTADDTDDLYDYARKKGYRITRGELIDGKIERNHIRFYDTDSKRERLVEVRTEYGTMDRKMKELEDCITNAYLNLDLNEFGAIVWDALERVFGEVNFKEINAYEVYI